MLPYMNQCGCNRLASYSGDMHISSCFSDPNQYESKSISTSIHKSHAVACSPLGSTELGSTVLLHVVPPIAPVVVRVVRPWRLRRRWLLLLRCRWLLWLRCRCWGAVVAPYATTHDKRHELDTSHARFDLKFAGKAYHAWTHTMFVASNEDA